MDEEVEELVVRVRADTASFRRDVEDMRAQLDGPLVAGVERAGRMIERSLARAIRTGKLSFEDLKQAALSALAQIAAASLKALATGGKGGGGIGGVLASLLGAPGRSHGGPVAEARPYLVGERGPELFVPGSSGRIEPLAGGNGPVRVNIALTAPAPTGEIIEPGDQRFCLDAADLRKNAGKKFQSLEKCGDDFPMIGNVMTAIRSYYVTGGAGFIGAHFVNRLLDSRPDARVTVLDNFITGRRWHFGERERDRRLTIIEADARDRGVL